MDWYRWAAVHDGQVHQGSHHRGCQHESALFLIWHHAYLTVMEAYLQHAARVMKDSGELSTQEFKLPYWDFLSDSKTPTGFFGSNDLETPLRFSRNGQVLVGKHGKYRDEWQKYRSIASFTCSTPSSIGLGGDKSGGVVEERLHNDFHNSNITGLNNPNQAASDPLFHSFHAGVDRLLVEWLANNQGNPWLKCELCATTIESFVDSTGDKTWAARTFNFPKTSCLSGLKRKNDHTGFELDTTHGCALDNDGNLPLEAITIKQILSEKRFWSNGYWIDGVKVKVGPPCETPAKDCQWLPGDTFRCPNAPVSVSTSPEPIKVLNRIGEVTLPSIPEVSEGRISAAELRIDHLSVTGQCKGLTVELQSGNEWIVISELSVSPFRDLSTGPMVGQINEKGLQLFNQSGHAASAQMKLRLRPSDLKEGCEFSAPKPTTTSVYAFGR